MKILVLLILFSSYYSYAAVKEFDLAKGKLILENGSGKLQILGQNQNKVKVEYTKSKWRKNCNLILKQSGTTVYVKVNKKRRFTGNECQVDFNVTIPKNLFTSIKSGSGDLSLRSISGALDFKTGSGDVAGQEISSPKVSGTSGSGDISLKGTFSNADIKTGSGKISAHLERVKKPSKFFAKSGSGDISLKGTFLDADIKTGSGKIFAHFERIKKLSKFFARSGSGDISIMVPKNSTVEVNFKSGSGVLKNKTSYSDNPNLKVNVRTGSGDLKIESIERNQNRI